MAETTTATSSNSVVTSPVKKPWQSKDGKYHGGLKPVRFAGGDPYANDPTTTK